MKPPPTVQPPAVASHTQHPGAFAPPGRNPAVAGRHRPANSCERHSRVATRAHAPNGHLQHPSRLGRFHQGLVETPRFWHALIALNLHKTAYHLHRKRRRSRCQHPSDTGKAFETGCDAIVHYRLRPAQFRRVCPLLRQCSDGAWCCSVDAEDVRPFWGRAALHALGLAAGIYLTLALAAFCFLSAVGYPVNLGSVVWPPKWHEVRQARAAYALTKAQGALRQHNPMKALMLVAQSYSLDRSNYGAGRMLAQLGIAGGLEYSNQLYAQLMSDHPERREATAQAWLTLAIANGDFATVQNLSRQQMEAASPNRAVWLRAFLVANRRTGDSTVLQHAAQDPQLPADFREICRLELALRNASRDEARRLLAQSLTARVVPAPTLVCYRVERLLELGWPDDALAQLGRWGRILSPVERSLLSFDTYQSMGWSSFASEQFDQLLNNAPNAALLELLSAHLIRYPDRVLLAKACAALDRHPLAGDSQEGFAYTSLFCAAGAAGDWDQMHNLAGHLQALSGSQLPALAALESYFRRDYRSTSLRQCIPVLMAVPTEVNYALLKFFDAKQPEAKRTSAALQPAVKGTS